MFVNAGNHGDMKNGIIMGDIYMSPRNITTKKKRDAETENVKSVPNAK